MPDETLPAPPVLVPDLTRPDHYAPDAPPGLVAQARQFVGVARWTWARTFERFAPHWYSLRRESPPVGYAACRELIREYGDVRRWKSREFRAVTIGGVTAWIMEDDPGTHNGGVILINAVVASDADWPTPEAPTLFDH